MTYLMVYAVADCPTSIEQRVWRTRRRRRNVVILLPFGGSALPPRLAVMASGPLTRHLTTICMTPQAHK